MVALPVAQAPILVLAGLLQISPVYVLGAFLLGKSIKYTLVAVCTVNMEDRLVPLARKWNESGIRHS
jgi:membrane protein YqaA with SNARE-associated domain